MITDALFMSVHRILPEVIPNDLKSWLDTKFKPIKGKCTLCIQYGFACHAKVKNGRLRCVRCRQYGKTCDASFLSFEKMSWVLAHVYRACDETSVPSTPSEAIATPPSSPRFDPVSPPQYDYGAQRFVENEHYNSYKASSAPFLAKTVSA